MNQDTYYLIQTDDKGMASVSTLKEWEVKKRLAELVEDEDAEEVLKRFLIPGRKVLNLSYTAHSYILIKGEALKPKPAEKITKIEI